MKRMLCSGLLLAGLLGGSLFGGAQKAEASKPYKPVLKLDCKKCHTSAEEAKMTDKDLNACGTKSYDALKKAGYTRTKDVAKQTEWAKKLKAMGFKC